MKTKTCEICGSKIELGWVEKHHVVPMDVTQQAGVPESKIVTLCHSCHQELHRWYLAKVVKVAYDTKSRRFKSKSWAEMLRGYDYAFDSFVEYKRKQSAEH
jgi:predicted HNH restriction endonuclease